jgi:hypothetical protein
MRNLHLEAALWNLFTSTEFFEAAARECDDTMKWFGTLAVSRHVADFGRNNQIFDKFKKRANDFRRGAELARLGDYEFIWNVSESISGDVRGMMEQPLHSWMTEAEYQEFSGVRISRLLAYARKITSALNNAMTAADSFFEPDPDCPERCDDDDGFPGEKIVEAYHGFSSYFDGRSFAAIPDPLPEYLIDRATICRTGDEVPWTGVWYPSTGIERRSLAFAIKGLRMQPAYTIVKTIEELEAEGDDVMFFSPQTVAEATTWHPMIPSGRQIETNKELRAKAGEPCPKTGIWQPMDPGAPTRAYEAGEPMANFGSAYGITVWQWVADR